MDKLERYVNRHSEHAVTWAHAQANITMCASLGLHLDYKNHSEWKLNRIRHVKHHVSPQRSRNQLTEGSIRMRCHRDPMTPESTSSHSRKSVRVQLILVLNCILRHFSGYYNTARSPQIVHFRSQVSLVCLRSKRLDL